jgi:hypothetical protein
MGDNLPTCVVIVLLSCSDARYRATVGAMPCQQLGISFIRHRQQHPQQLLLKIDGQERLLQVRWK